MRETAPVKGRSSGPALPDGLDMGYALSKLARMIARYNAARIDAVVGLTLAEWRVLLVLDGKRMQFDCVAERALLEKSHASTASRVLERRGLIRQSRDATDRRRAVLTRTRTGTALVKRYLDQTADEVRKFWSVLSAAEKAAFRRTLNKLLTAAQEQDRQTD